MTDREVAIATRNIMNYYLDASPIPPIEPPPIIIPPHPPMDGYVEFNTPYEIVRDRIINGWVKVNAPYVTFENLTLTGTNKDTNLFWAGHGTKLIGSVLRSSPEGQHRGGSIGGIGDASR